MKPLWWYIDVDGRLVFWIIQWYVPLHHYVSAGFYNSERVSDVLGCCAFWAYSQAEEVDVACYGGNQVQTSIGNDFFEQFFTQDIVTLKTYLYLSIVLIAHFCIDKLKLSYERKKTHFCHSELKKHSLSEARNNNNILYIQCIKLYWTKF